VKKRKGGGSQEVKGKVDSGRASRIGQTGNRPTRIGVGGFLGRSAEKKNCAALVKSGAAKRSNWGLGRCKGVGIKGGEYIREEAKSVRKLEDPQGKIWGLS